MHMPQQLQHWADLQFEVALEQEDFCAWLMFQCGTQGCEIKAIDQGKVLVKASFAASDLSEQKISELIARLEEYGLSECLTTLKVDQYGNEDWLSKWRENFEPCLVGERFVVCPPWRKHEAKSFGNRQMIVINPGMAFGTGLHATTQYCLKTIERRAVGPNILDVGTGSGILAIACALLYPGVSVTALDNNPNVLNNARENIRLNNVESSVNLLEGQPENVALKKFDTILSNLTCEDIIALLPIYIRLLTGEGKIICAGILQDKLAKLEGALVQYQLQIIDKDRCGEWVGVTLTTK